jgi:CcmD family protein
MGSTVLQYLIFTFPEFLLIVLSVILTGIGIYLFMLDKKIARLEKEINNSAENKDK